MASMVTLNRRGFSTLKIMLISIGIVCLLVLGWFVVSKNREIQEKKKALDAAPRVALVLQRVLEGKSNTLFGGETVTVSLDTEGFISSIRISISPFSCGFVEGFYGEVGAVGRRAVLAFACCEAVWELYMENPLCFQRLGQITVDFPGYGIYTTSIDKAVRAYDYVYKSGWLTSGDEMRMVKHIMQSWEIPQRDREILNEE